MRFPFALLLIVLLTASAAADRKQALTYFRAGEKAYKAQNFEAAATNFHEAFKELPLPEIAFSAAQAFRRAHRVKANSEYVRLAVELYAFYLDKVKSGGRVGDAADSLEAMQHELDKLGGSMKRPAAPVEERTRIGITVTLLGAATDAPGESMREVSDTADREAEIIVTTMIDGKAVEPDVMVDVEPGERLIRAEAPGFTPIERKERVVKGNSGLIPLSLEPLPARVTVRTEGGARVSIDGNGVSAGTAVDVPAGRHVITVLRTGRKPVAREIVVQRGQTLTVEQPLTPTLRRRSVKWVAGGAGVLLLLTGSLAAAAVYQDGVASDRQVELESGNQSPALKRSYENAITFRDDTVTGTWIVGGTAVAVGLTAAVLYYVDTPSPEGIRVEPFAGGGVGGAQVIGRF